MNFCFSGWVRGANIKEVTDTATGRKLDITDKDEQEVLAKLNSGEYSISLGDFLYCSRKNEISLFDFDKD